MNNETTYKSIFGTFTRPVENDNKPKTCKACGKAIVFLPTSKGKYIPVNLESYGGESEFYPGVHVAHFSDCPQAKEFRKVKK
ncbi:MAG: hypothetical protein LCH52_08425 [Bacteroidetes bacterium]|nr:hypothetical protein [Bacteroidota bacterium]